MLDILLSIAFTFSLLGSDVQLVGEIGEGYYCVNVIDEGPGISVEDQKRMFQKFVRLSNLPTGGESSTGLGLSIVNELVERLGGKIKVFSEVGSGSTFRVCLPISEHQPAPETSLEDASPN